MSQFKLPGLLALICLFFQTPNLCAQESAGGEPARIGIGTTTPDETLDVNGGIKIGHTDNLNFGTMRYNFLLDRFEGYTIDGWQSLQSFWHPDTADPTQMNLNPGFAGIAIGAGVGQSTIENELGDLNISVDGDVRLIPSGGGYMRMGNSGWVVIENGWEDGFWHTSGNSNWASMTVNNIGSGKPAYAYRKSDLLLGRHYLDDSNNWVLDLNDMGTLTPHFFVGANGRVGVGTTTPSRNMEVANYIRVTEEEGSADGCYIELLDGGTDVGSFDFRLDNSGMFMWVSDSDNDFINTADFGDIAYFGNGTSTYKFRVFGDAAKPGGGSWTNPSDRRLKHDIQPFTDGLPTILQINPVTYRYNGKMGLPSDKEYIGIIAQDMQQIAPYTVTEVTHQGRQSDPDNGEQYLAFDPSSLDFMLINGVKELAVENQQLKAENKVIKDKLAALEQMILDLQKKIGD